MNYDNFDNPTSKHDPVEVRLPKRIRDLKQKIYTQSLKRDFPDKNSNHESSRAGLGDGGRSKQTNMLELLKAEFGSEKAGQQPKSTEEEALKKYLDEVRREISLMGKGVIYHNNIDFQNQVFDKLFEFWDQSQLNEFKYYL
jgi:hypothetical protein